MIYYALILFFVVDYVRPGAHLPAIAFLNSIVPLLALPSGLVSPAPVSYSRVLADPNTRWLLGFILLLLVSMVTSPVTMLAYNSLLVVLPYTVLNLVISRHINSLQRLRGLFKTFVAIHLMLAALTPEMFTDPSSRHYLTSGAFMGDGNDFALSVNIAIPMCLFLFLEATSGGSRVLYFGLLLVLVACVIVTQSRGGTVALAAIGLYYWVRSDRKLLTGAVATFVIAAVLALAPPAYFARMNTLSNVENDGSAQGRINAWKAGVAMAMRYPLVGVGAGHFVQNFQRFKPPEDDTLAWKTAHSIYFLMLGELGFPGLFLTVGMIAWNLRENRRTAKAVRARAAPGARMYDQLLSAVNASLLAYAVGGAFLSAAYYPHIFVLLGLLTATRRMTTEFLEARSEAQPERPERRASAYLPALAPKTAQAVGPLHRGPKAISPAGGRYF